MFVSETEDKLPQYPRRPEDEDFWRLVYFAMYGLFATQAQYGGLMISKRTITREALVLYSRIYGAFHLVIGVHHLMWSLKRDHGKLEIWRYHLPGVYAGTTLSALIMMYHAFCIVRVNGRTANLTDICYRKAVLDTASFATLISSAGFLVCNIAGIETSFETERMLWAITMYSIPTILVLSFVLQG